MLTLACVLRSGGDFTADHVSAIARARDFISEEIRVVCLTDIPLAIKTSAVDRVLPLIYDWPNWWAKMELFRLAAPVLYLDLDTLVCGDITPLARYIRTMPQLNFVMARDPYHNNGCSTIMGWNEPMGWLLDTFRQEAIGAEFYPRTHGIGAQLNGVHLGGDQEWIRNEIDGRRHLVFAQDIQGGIYSYKCGIVAAGAPPDDIALVFYHGLPRPAEDDLCASLRKREPVKKIQISEAAVTGVIKAWQE